MKSGLTFFGLILLFTGFVQPGPKVKLSIYMKGKLMKTYYGDQLTTTHQGGDEWYQRGKYVCQYDSAVYEIGSQNKYSPLQKWK